MEFKTLIMITPADYKRLEVLYPFLLQHLCGELVFVGSNEVGEYVKASALGTGVSFLCEDDILPFQSVHAVMKEHLKSILNGKELPRGVTGWYYQQFLKMQYSRISEDAYYMVWDGDTIPCRKIEMFDPNTGQPYMDLKREYHKEYFDTIEKLFDGMKKSIDHSYIAEHMLMKTDIMRQMLQEIEEKDALSGNSFWEKIIRVIEPEKIQQTAFSEFETYGTYCSYRLPDVYKKRRWHSFRLGAEFFDPTTISQRDFDWLGKDFDAISFEKNQSVREDHRNLFDNPYYQAKLSARQMLQIAQEEFGDGYLELWEDEDPLLKKLSDKADTLDEIEPYSAIRYLPGGTWREYEGLGDKIVDRNVNQAYLCYENAVFLCDDREEKKRLSDKIKAFRKENEITVRKAAIVILSYNNKYLLQRCVESIFSNCNPDRYSLVILDNASTDGVVDWLKEQSADKMTLLLSDENMGFAGGCNAAAAFVANDQDILFLNNDTRMPANALFWMQMALYEKDSVGATGGVQNYGTRPQHIDVDLAAPELYMEFGARNNVAMEQAVTDVPKLSGFALLVRRSVWDAVGGFDEQFSPGYFEDDDLCMRIRNAGYTLKVCKNAFIYHAGSQSFAKKKDIEELFERNRQKFIAKWGAEIST